jgi:hypothetical protein
MTVYELRTILAGLPDDHAVVLASSAEGNRYSPLAALERGFYWPEQPWVGHFVSREEHVQGQSIAVPANAVALFPTR